MFAPHPLVNRLSTNFCGKYMHLKIQCQSSELRQLSLNSNPVLNYDILAGKFCRFDAVQESRVAKSWRDCGSKCASACICWKSWEAAEASRAASTAFPCWRNSLERSPWDCAVSEMRPSFSVCKRVGRKIS